MYSYPYSTKYVSGAHALSKSISRYNPFESIVSLWSVYKHDRVVKILYIQKLKRVFCNRELRQYMYELKKMHIYVFYENM